MEINVDPNTQHIVTVTPGLPLVLGDVSMPRATADCSLCGLVASGNANVVIEIAVEHA